MDNPGFQNDDGAVKPLPKKPPLVRANSLMVPTNKSWLLTQPVRPKLCRCNSVLVPKTCCLEEFEKSPEKTAKDLSSFFNKFSSPAKHNKLGDQALWPRPLWNENYDRLHDSASESKTKISTIYEPKFLTSKLDYNGWSKTKHTASPCRDGGAHLKKELWPGGWKLEFVDTRHITASQKVATILCAFILTLLASGNVIYILRTVQTSTESPNKSAWIDVVLINGEFRITNELYREPLANTSSEDFQRLSGLLSQQIDNLFSLSTISGPYHSAAVTHFTPGLVAHCQIVLKSSNEGSSGNVGLAFLGGLRHQHGKVWLGNYSIDILSIGFQSNSDGISWSDWTEWSECKDAAGLGLVRVRSRNCTLRSGAYLYSTIPCLLIPQSRGNIETLPCRHYRRATPLQFVLTTPAPPLSGTMSATDMSSTTVQPHEVAESFSSPTTGSTAAANIHPVPPVTASTSPSTTTPPTVTTSLGSITSTLVQSSTPVVDYGFEVINITEEISNSVLTVNVMNLTLAADESINNKTDERKACECSGDEVCVALVDETVPQCVKVKDSADPTGCGGHCKINVQICQRIQGNAYRCVDDSKCLDDEWQCGNKLCIPLIKRCDGHFNCYDHTDEFECDCNLTTHFHCGNQMSCIPLSKRCDAIVDCWDAADEINCTTHCVGAEQFTCNDSQCIPNHRFCDGFADCRDRSDEPFGCGGECKKHEWRCINTRCISKANVCNKIDDCGDNSDETDCITTN